MSSEALAYPLVIAAVYAATRAIAAPTRRAQVAFIALAVLATMARVQFAVLPIVFVLATVLVGARERRTKEALREQLLPLCVFVLAAGAVLASGPAHTVGVYRWLFGLHTGPLGVVHWAALDAMTLAYTAGWIIVPGALLGVWLTLARPRSTDELAFGVVAVLLVAALFFEAGLLQASLDLGKEIQERYVFYAAPATRGLLRALCVARVAPAHPSPRPRGRARPRLRPSAAERLRGRVDARRLAHPVRRLLADRQARASPATPPR